MQLNLKITIRILEKLIPPKIMMLLIQNFECLIRYEEKKLPNNLKKASSFSYI